MVFSETNCSPPSSYSYRQTGPHTGMLCAELHTSSWLDWIEKKTVIVVNNCYNNRIIVFLRFIFMTHFYFILFYLGGGGLNGSVSLKFQCQFVRYLGWTWLRCQYIVVWLQPCGPPDISFRKLCLAFVRILHWWNINPLKKKSIPYFHLSIVYSPLNCSHCCDYTLSVPLLSPFVLLFGCHCQNRVWATWNQHSFQPVPTM